MVINHSTVIDAEDEDLSNELQRAQKYLEQSIDKDKFVNFDDNYSTLDPLNDDIITKNYIDRLEND